MSTEKWLCQFPINDLVVLQDVALHCFVSRINWVNKTTSKKEIIKTECDSVNHTRFPKNRHCFAFSTAKSSGHYRGELVGMFERKATSHRTTHHKTACGSMWQQRKGQPILIRNKTTQHWHIAILEPATLLADRAVQDRPSLLHSNRYRLQRHLVYRWLNRHRSVVTINKKQMEQKNWIVY